MKKYRFITLVLIAITLPALISQVYATPPRRGDECTWNSGLLRAYPTTWDPYVWNWNVGNGWRVGEDQYSYVHWYSDGLVTMRCEDHGGFDGIWLATNFDQGVPQGLINVDLATNLNLWLEASTSIPVGPTDVPLISWTGVKFDIIIAEKSTGRIIMMEMYFWRTGANTVWIYDFARKTDPNSNVWNYLVALDWMRYLYGNGYNVEWDANGRHYFAINVYGLLKRAIDRLNSATAPNPPFNIANFKLAKVDFCCESGNTGGLFGGPWVYAELYSLRSRYYTADINGDGVVNILDATFIGLHYGAKFGETNYDFRADLNTDGIINILDSSFLGANWGKTY